MTNPFKEDNVSRIRYVWFALAFGIWAWWMAILVQVIRGTQ